MCLRLVGRCLGAGLGEAECRLTFAQQLDVYVGDPATTMQWTSSKAEG